MDILKSMRLIIEYTAVHAIFGVVPCSQKAPYSTRIKIFRILLMIVSGRRTTSPCCGFTTRDKSQKV